ncbi:MAG: transglutaminase family protein [Pseudomonadales bacterium]|nr:transglutaminase family protein [Pseudomonadales bacterium]
MRRLKIWHETRYEFSERVTLLPQRLLLRPREGHEVRIDSFRLSVSPEAQLKSHRDIYDNSITVASFSEGAQALVMLSEVELQNFNDAPLDFLVEDYALFYPFSYREKEVSEMFPYFYVQNGEFDQVLRNWLSNFWQPGQGPETYALLQNLCVGIHTGLQYRVREEPGVQTPAQTLNHGSGSCRDFANLFMAAARMLGLAARFVSGYLYAPVSEQGLGSTHAWAEVYLPGAGWKGFDPTIGKLAGSDHIPVAVAAWPDAVPPVAGDFIGLPGLAPALYVSVSVKAM